MRCPKCGYNSFEHNLNCPKCRKDLTVIRRQLNLTMPAPGPVNFFQTAGQRSVFPEPVLGADAADNNPMADPFAAPAFGGAAPFAGAAAGAAAVGFGGAAAVGQGLSPFGQESPFGAAPGSGPMIDDLLPAEDDSIDDIAPIEEISPLEAQAIYPEPVPQAYPMAPPPGYPAAPQAYPAAPQAYPAAAPPSYPSPAPMPPSFGAPPMPQAPMPTGPAALAPDLADDEIEIEIDPMDDALPSAAPMPEGFQQQASVAMDQIKNTLAGTGDLASLADGVADHFDVNSFAVPEIDPEPQLYEIKPEPIMPPLQPDPQFAPMPEPVNPMMPAPVQAQQPPETPPKEDLTALVDEINLDDLDSDL